MQQSVPFTAVMFDGQVHEGKVGLAEVAVAKLKGVEIASDDVGKLVTVNLLRRKLIPGSFGDFEATCETFLLELVDELKVHMSERTIQDLLEETKQLLISQVGDAKGKRIIGQIEKLAADTVNGSEGKDRAPTTG